MIQRVNKNFKNKISKEDMTTISHLYYSYNALNNHISKNNKYINIMNFSVYVKTPKNNFVSSYYKGFYNKG